MARRGNAEVRALPPIPTAAPTGPLPPDGGDGGNEPPEDEDRRRIPSAEESATTEGLEKIRHKVHKSWPKMRILD